MYSSTRLNAEKDNRTTTYFNLQKATRDIKQLVKGFDGNVNGQTVQEWLDHAQPVIRKICPSNDDFYIAYLMMACLPKQFNTILKRSHINPSPDIIVQELHEAYPLRNWILQYDQRLHSKRLFDHLSSFSLAKGRCIRAWELLGPSDFIAQELIDHIIVVYFYMFKEAMRPVPFIKTSATTFINDLNGFFDQIHHVQEYLVKLRELEPEIEQQEKKRAAMAAYAEQQTN